MSPKNKHPQENHPSANTTNIDIPENIRFLFNSYSNTQQTIQFFDTKAGAYVAFNGALASLITSNIVKVINELSTKSHPISKYILVSLVGITALLFLYLVAQVFYQSLQVLAPRKGPAKIVGKGKATGLFWAGNVVEYLQSHKLDEYATTMTNLTQHAMVAELSYETAKIAYITDEKLRHLEQATSYFKRSIIVWVCLLLGLSVLEIFLPYLW